MIKIKRETGNNIHMKMTEVFHSIIQRNTNDEKLFPHAFRVCNAMSGHKMFPIASKVTTVYSYIAT